MINNKNKYKYKYSCIRSLQLDDVKFFIETYINNIPQSKFKNRYNVFRAAYWSETSGSTYFTNSKTVYKSLIRIYYIYNRENKNTINLLLNDSNLFRLINPNIGFIWNSELY